jgi:hypothetical protein
MTMRRRCTELRATVEPCIGGSNFVATVQMLLVTCACARPGGTPSGAEGAVEREVRSNLGSAHCLEFLQFG